MIDNIRRIPLNEFLKLNNCEGKAVYFATYPEEKEKDFVIMERDNYEELAGIIKEFIEYSTLAERYQDELDLPERAKTLLTKLGE